MTDAPRQPLTRLLRSHPLPQGEGRPGATFRVRPLSLGERVVAERPGEGCRPLHKITRQRQSHAREGSRSIRIQTRQRLSHGIAPRDIQHPPYLFKHPGRAPGNIGIGEADFLVSGGLDRGGPQSVGFGLVGVMDPVKLDRQPRRLATKIDDEPGDRRLPPELPAVNATAAQFLPQPHFGAGRGFPQVSGDCRFSLHHGPMVRADRRCNQPLTRSLRDHPLPRGEGSSGARS